MSKAPFGSFHKMWSLFELMTLNRNLLGDGTEKKKEKDTNYLHREDINHLKRRYLIFYGLHIDKEGCSYYASETNNVLQLIAS